MKYSYRNQRIPQSKRKMVNEKILYLIASGMAQSNDITREDIYNGYTGDGGLHGLERSDYDSYHSYSEAKKEIEQGQFFTPPAICEFMVGSLKLSAGDRIADLTCGIGNFFNFVPSEENAYGCELDVKAHKVAAYLYPAARIQQNDIHNYQPDVRFDYVVGNPPFHLNWKTETGEKMESQLYYCMKAAQLLKPMGILALLVPCSFLSDTFADAKKIQRMEDRFSFLGQLLLPEDAFSYLGVSKFATKIQFWQKRSDSQETDCQKYSTEYAGTLPSRFDPVREAEKVYRQLIALPKSRFEDSSAKILLELARSHDSSKAFQYEVQKLLYQIKVHPATKDKYARCCELLHTFYTQKQPENMTWEEWRSKKLTEGKVLSQLRRVLKRQNRKPEADQIRLVLRDGQFVYKGYSAKARREIPEPKKVPVPVYQAVLNNQLNAYPSYERLLRRKRREYEIQNTPFSEMKEDPSIANWLEELTIWDSLNEEPIRLNPIQRHDLNLVLQKRYTLLQWEQGSGKTLAAIVTGLYRMRFQHIHSTWVVSSAISILPHFTT